MEKEEEEIGWLCYEDWFWAVKPEVWLCEGTKPAVDALRLTDEDVVVVVVEVEVAAASWIAACRIFSAASLACCTRAMMSRKVTMGASRMISSRAYTTSATPPAILDCDVAKAA